MVATLCAGSMPATVIEAAHVAVATKEGQGNVLSLLERSSWACQAPSVERQFK